jgi:hypothetical protein
MLACFSLSAGEPTIEPLRAEPQELLAYRFQNPVSSDCTCKGKKLYGKVKVVTVFADFDVEVVESFPDLDVQKVNVFANKCGKWQFVDVFPDFTIRYVKSSPDFKIRFVNSFPGVK